MGGYFDTVRDIQGTCPVCGKGVKGQIRNSTDPHKVPCPHCGTYLEDVRIGDPYDVPS